MSDPLTTAAKTVADERSAGRFCIACDYNLRGLTAPRCPECGRAFDPSDSSSFGTRPLTSAARLVLRARNWSVLLLVTAAIICWLASYCMPGQWSAGRAACGWIWLSLLVLVLGQFVIFRFVADRFFHGGGPKFNHRPWILATASLGVILALNWVHLPGRLVFWLSRPMLDHVAQSLYASQGGIGPRQIGLYSFESAQHWQAELGRAQKRGGGTFKARAVCFESDEDSQIEDVWLVYCPDGDPADLPRDVRDCFTPLGGGWYEWHEGPRIFPPDN